MPDLTVDHDKAIEAARDAQEALSQVADLRKEVRAGFKADKEQQDKILTAVNALKSEHASLSATAGNVSVKWILGACISMATVIIAAGTLGLALVGGIGSLASKPMQNSIANNHHALEEHERIGAHAHAAEKIVQHKSAIDYNSQAITALQDKVAELNAAALNGKRQATAIALVHQRIRQLELQASIVPPGEDDIYHPNGH